MALDAGRWVALGCGALILACGGAILAAGPRRPANQAFAALVALRGLNFTAIQLASVDGWEVAAVRVQYAAQVASVAVSLGCATHLVPRLHAFVRRPGLLSGMLGVALVAVTLALPDAYATLERGQPTLLALRAAPHLIVTQWGPLAAVGGLMSPLLGLLAWLATRPVRPGEAPLRRVAMRPLAAGLMLGAVLEATMRMVILPPTQHGAYPWAPWGWSQGLVPMLGIVPAVMAAIAMSIPEEGPRAWPVTVAATAFAFGFLRLAFPGQDAAGQTVLMLLSLSRVAMPCLVAVAFVTARRARPSPTTEGDRVPPASAAPLRPHPRAA